jgi:flagellar export protein FliJ
VKKFKFRLEQVLRYRESLKSERRRELLEANRVLQDAEERVGVLLRAVGSYGIAEGAQCSVADLELRARFRERAAQDLAAQRELVARRRHEAQEAIDRYIEASKEANALDALKKKRSQEYLERIQRLEQAADDEATVQRVGRRKREELTPD